MRPLPATFTLLLATLPAGTMATADLGVELLAAGCNACHGPDGRGSAPVPALRGREDLRQQLDAWRVAPEATGQSHVMIRFARALDEADVEALAEHYAERDVP